MSRKKVIVVMPAYNASKTLEKTYRDIPNQVIDSIILVDDASQDDTIAVAKKLDLKIIVHAKNTGYGGNQKTCYTEALKDGADIIIMLHPDYQYDPSLIPSLIEPIENNEADAVLGSRFIVGSALASGMPWWKYIGNKVLTKIQNIILRQNLSEYHTGYRVYSREFLETVPFLLNSNNFIFDQEILVQAIYLGFRIKEVPIPTRYLPDSSSISFINSVIYGLDILCLLTSYIMHKTGIKQSPLLKGRTKIMKVKSL